MQGSERGEVVLAVQECVSAVASAYRGVSEATATIVEAVMLENVNTVSACMWLTVMSLRL